MVSLSSTMSVMDMRKLSLSDQVSSPRKKVISGFGFGIVMSFIVLSVILYNSTSFKPPFSNPVFSVGSNFNGSFFSWPFSRGISYNNSSSFGSNDSVTINDAIGVGSVNGSLDLLNSGGKDSIFVGNVSGDLRDGHVELKVGSLAKDARNGNDSIGVEGNGVVESDLKANDQGEVRIVGADGGSHVRNGSGGNYSNNVDDKDSSNELVRDSSSYKDCDIFDGKWVRDESKPYYRPGSCPYIDRDFDCHLNGRPDSAYVKWRWQPRSCNIPSFNSTDFLERLRGQKLVFVGDSLNRNMWESLVCMLRAGVRDKKRVYEISGRHEFKKKGFYAFRFEDYNCSVDFVSSPFLVKESSFKTKNGSFETLRLDLMDGTTSMYHDADVLIFNTGHWWTHEKTARGEDYYQEGNHIHPRLKVLEAFKRALVTWAKWVDKNVDSSKSHVIFRGYSVTHFRGGPWNSGGQCHKETEPIFNDEHLAKYPSKMKILEYVVKDMRTPVTYLNISQLTDYRKDAHPSVYRPDYQAAQQEVHAQDCSHWCLPGVPDTWNELLYVSLLKSGPGSWKS